MSMFAGVQCPSVHDDKGFVLVVRIVYSYGLSY